MKTFIKKIVMKINFLYLVLLCIFYSGCTSDGESRGDNPRFEGVEGIVISSVSCQTKNNGLAYEISIENFEAIERIITPNLPDQFKENGLEIQFNMKNSNEGITACVSRYFPEDFYIISDIKLKDKADEN